MQTPNSETSKDESLASDDLPAGAPTSSDTGSISASKKESGPIPFLTGLAQKNLFAYAVVLAVLAAFFYKAVFLGKPITKLGLLLRIDAVLNPALKDAIIPIGRDPSGYLIFFPNGHFCEQVWSRLVIPLWNPLVACGFPLLGDPQSFIHSPAHLLHLFASPAAYNFGLLLEIALGGVGMVLLARLMSLSYAAAILAALAYSLSPRVLVQIDIGGNEELFPWIVACFVWLAKKPSYLRSAIAGMASAFLVFAAHPETSFFAVLTAGVLGFCLIAVNGPAGFSSADSGSAGILPASRAASSDSGSAGILPASPAASSTSNTIFSAANIWLSTKLMAVAAFVSMLVVSPVVVPFVQFMRQATIYKDAMSAAELPVVGWKDFWDGVVANQGYEPYFIGSIAVLLIPLAFTSKNRNLLALALTSFFIFAIAVPQGPILDLFSKKPWNYVATLYGVPDLLLLFSILAGFGLDSLMKAARKSLVLALFVGLLVSAVLPFIFCLGGSNGVIADAWKANRSLITYTSIFASAGFLFALLWLFLPNRITKFLAIAALLSLNFASIAVPSRNILPNCPPYDMTPTAALKFLGDSGERTVSTGNNFVLPNASMNYGVRDLRCFCPVLPRRYMEFLKASGARIYNNYFYRMPDACSDLLDIASVKYVLTRSAVSGLNDSTAPLTSLGKSAVGGVMPGMRLVDTSLFYDPPNKQVQFDFALRLQKPLDHRYAIQFCTVDQSDEIVWTSAETRVSIVDARMNNQYKEYIPIPESARFPVKVGFRVKDTWTSQWVMPSDTLKKEQKGLSSRPEASFSGSASTRDYNDAHTVFVVAELAGQNPMILESSGVAPGREVPVPHYRLVHEFQNEGCRVYENTRALPQAYFVKDVLHIAPQAPDNYSALLDKLQDVNFDMHKSAIVEDQPKSDAGSASTQSGASVNDNLRDSSHVIAAKVERPDTNSVVCSIDAPASGYLVLTDSNYEGWHCSIDGKDAKIYDCNLLFKAVAIDAGKHTVRFVFAPVSYYLSLAVSLLSILVIGILAYLRRKTL